VVVLVIHVFYRDGLGGISTRHPEHDVGCDLTAEAERYFRVATSSAADVTIDLLRDHSARSITYIALGPMTNLYHTLQQDESTFRSQIGRVVCMGGECGFHFIMFCIRSRL
jgi:inosine-uridine nucleoside N-ribohydrolase